jgi:hypothetical protein
LAQIQSSNHEPVHLLGVVPFDHTVDPYPMLRADTLERELHNEFHQLARFSPGTRGSEWFNVSEGLLERVKELSVPPEQLGLARQYCSPVPSNSREVDPPGDAN